MMMGHGFNNFRDINYINPAVVPILKACFQMGVEKESNIKGVLEMEEECEKKLPYLLVPYRHAIKDWLYAQLEKQKNQTSSSGEKKTNKNKKERNHRIAVEISKNTTNT